ncbi:formylglycine-generating enzyme family protein [Leifsonia sp. Root112D2]|uniref:formylglycine-generating enzyme family protein n=1 Tax=Leifsonia sp. Root112D2 TaxID=1736426 RepID=UPI0006FC9859|nr:formylglycine-generating enzyme family protein [Leifsonia sp. Root112D2]KQV07450.1 sulfatase modifying factor 1 (C-alpha-formyglycine- generating enzyme 1) [Leifsonia sp. Root112D2]
MHDEHAGHTGHHDHADEHDCCAPSRPETSVSESTAVPSVLGATHATATPRDEVVLPGGTFSMGDPFDEGYASDGEVPVHAVELAPFSIDATCVTVEQFAAFVDATAYVTEAERFGNSAVFHLAVRAEPSEVIGTFGGTPWWLAVQGADWRHPFGSLSSVDEASDHPVVHVSHNDALAYCAWAGRALPTEAQWEFAARGGHVGRRFPWGDELEQGRTHHANVWQGDFPRVNTAEDGWLATAPVRSFAPNDYGLYETSGNVWEWCSDWFAVDYYSTSPRQAPRGPETGSNRVTRGGSYLCHHSYCSRYRLSARSSNTPDSSSGNTGFRTVSPEAH